VLRWNDDLPRLQPRLAFFENEGRIALKQADDVDRMGLVHGRMPGLIDDVMRTAEFREPLARDPVEFGFPDSGRRRMDHKPSDLHIALAGSEHGPAWSKVIVPERIERSRRGIFPNLEEASEIRAARMRRRSAVDNNDRLSVLIVAGNHAPQRILKR